MNSLDFPVNNGQAAAYAIDLNGDAHADNQLGSTLASLEANGFPTPSDSTAQTIAGQIVHLVEIRSSDASFANDAAAKASWLVGKPTSAPPLFDGSDVFQPQYAIPAANFVAALSGGDFVSANPATTAAPVDLIVKMRVGDHTVDLPMQGCRLSFTVAGADLQGQVNGSVLKTEFDVTFGAAFATAINDTVQADPTSATAQSLLSLFDTTPKDGYITIDEVLSSGFYQSLFAPDVQIRNAQGGYAPNPLNTTPDSLSFGFGFSAVQSEIAIFIDGFDASSS